MLGVLCGCHNETSIRLYDNCLFNIWLCSRCSLTSLDINVHSTHKRRETVHAFTSKALGNLRCFRHRAFFHLNGPSLTAVGHLCLCICKAIKNRTVRQFTIIFLITPRCHNAVDLCEISVTTSKMLVGNNLQFC